MEPDEDIEPARSWEYAILVWDGDGSDDYRVVRFSHRQTWSSIAGDQYLPTLGQLGDDGFELVTHQFLQRGKYDRGGLYGESIREVLTFKRPNDE
jgi:hypothetical protein